MRKKLLLIYGFVIALSCSKNKQDPAVVYNVPPEFQTYVTRFIDEAAIRGHNIVISNLIIKYDSTLDNSFCAKSNIISADPNIQKIISINPKVQCYTYDEELETLIFHEMGHCILGRNHENSRLPNGDPKSIMIEDDLSLYSPCIYPLNDSCKDNSF